jgi:hypothetical protein
MMCFVFFPWYHAKSKWHFRYLVLRSLFFETSSSALSFQSILWYSSNGCAPIARSSPRAKAGFKMFVASIALSATSCTKCEFRQWIKQCPLRQKSLFTTDCCSQILLVFGTSNQCSHIKEYTILSLSGFQERLHQQFGVPILQQFFQLRVLRQHWIILVRR